MVPWIFCFCNGNSVVIEVNNGSVALEEIATKNDIMGKVLYDLEFTRELTFL